MANWCLLCMVDLDQAPCFCIAKGLQPRLCAQAPAEMTPPPALVPGPRPAGVCCEVCRLTPGHGRTDGVRFVCARCSP